MKVSRLIKFPETRQSTNFSCGAASVQGILCYYGENIREDNLIKMMNVKPTSVEHSGVRPQGIVDFFKKRGFKSELYEGIGLEDLKSFLDKDIPVIVAIQAWNAREPGVGHYKKNYSDGHYVVAIGYGSDGFIFDDPSVLGHHAYLMNQEFLDRWHDEDSAGRKYEHLAISVYGKKPVFRPDVLKKIK